MKYDKLRSANFNIVFSKFLKLFYFLQRTHLILLIKNHFWKIKKVNQLDRKVQKCKNEKQHKMWTIFFTSKLSKKLQVGFFWWKDWLDFTYHGDWVHGLATDQHNNFMGKILASIKKTTKSEKNTITINLQKLKTEKLLTSARLVFTKLNKTIPKQTFRKIFIYFLPFLHH